MNMGMVALLAGGDVDSDLLRLMTEQEKEKQQKIEAGVKNLGRNVVTGYRYFKGPPKVIDATTQKEIDPSDPRYAGIMAKYRQEEDVTFAMFENLVNSTIEMALIFTKSSALEMELMARLMNRKPSDNRVSADSARFK